MSERSPIISARGFNKLNGCPLWQAVALKLYNEGYKVAVASRSQSDPTEGKALPLKVDVTKENDIISAFKQVTKSLGAPPNVVVYNGVLFNCIQTFNQLTLILCNSGSAKLSTSCRRPVFPIIQHVSEVSIRLHAYG